MWQQVTIATVIRKTYLFGVVGLRQLAATASATRLCFSLCGKHSLPLPTLAVSATFPLYIPSLDNQPISFHLSSADLALFTLVPATTCSGSLVSAMSKPLSSSPMVRSILRRCGPEDGEIPNWMPRLFYPPPFDGELTSKVSIPRHTMTWLLTAAEPELQ